MGKRKDRRRPIAQHARLTAPSALGSIFRFLAVAMATVLIAAGGVVAFLYVDLTSSFTANAVDIGGEDAVPPDIASYEGAVQILIAGTDQCEAQYAALFPERCDDTGDGANSDVLMLLNISAAPRKVTVVSFPRDLMVPIPECTDANGNAREAEYLGQINSAFNKGGLACTVATVRELTGQPIQYAASINWGGVMEMTDAIGGVTVCIGSPMYDRHTGIDWEAGSRQVSGYDALQFLRTRHGVRGESDLARISNQQQYLSRLVKKMMSEQVLSDPGTLLKLAKVAVESIDPSTSMADPNTLMQMALAVKDVPFDDFVFLKYPVADWPENTDRVIPIEADAEALWAAIASGQTLTVTGGIGGGSVSQADVDAAAFTDEDGDGLDDATGQPMPVEGEDPVATPPVDPTTGEEIVDPGVLPESVTGTSAAQDTCSDGVISND